MAVVRCWMWFVGCCWLLWWVSVVVAGATTDVVVVVVGIGVGVSICVL